MLTLPNARHAQLTEPFAMASGIAVAQPELVAALRALIARYGHACNLLERDGSGVRAVPPPASMNIPFAQLTIEATTTDDPAAVADDLPTLLVGAGEGGGEGDDDLADLILRRDSAGAWVWRSNGLYDAQTVASMAAHVAVLLQSAALHAEAPVASLNLLPGDERRLLLDEWNGTPRDYPDVLLHELFTHTARLQRHAVALEFGDQSMTYAELDRASNRLARRLIDAGAGGGSPVLVDGPRSLELMVAIYATWKAGGALLYADPLDPQPRVAAAAKAVSAEVVLTSDPERWQGGEWRAVLSTTDARTADGDLDSLPRRATAEDAASIIFTSGSTGVPKGVVRSHRMLASRLLLEQSIYQLPANERHLLKSPISARETVAPLMLGHVAVIAAPDGERDDAYLFDLIASHRISVIGFVPSMLRVLVASPRFASLTTLRHIYSGGETLDRALEDRVHAALGLDVHNTYTLTEADYICSRPRPTAHARHHMVIGRPTDMRVYLLDENGQLVPAGVVGEIHTGGAGVATAYAGQPELTRERFRPDPFDPAARWQIFRTGDLARFLPDGQLEYVGRVDDQIKIRGQRVEPAEVELALRSHPAVADAAVVAVPDPAQGARMVAFVVATADVPSLRSQVAGRLPGWMIPSRIELVPALPLLKSGKVDRGALRAMVVRPESRSLAPLTSTQERIAAMWTESLPDWRVALDDDFFSAGGDSLRLVSLRGRMEQAFDVTISLADLIESPSVARMATLIEQARRGEAAS